MKNKVQIKPDVKQQTSVKVTLVYTALGIAIAGIIISIIALIVNLGNPLDSKANNATYTSNQSGDWSNGTSWSSSTPSSSLNQDLIIINSYHDILHSGTLTAQNQTSFTVNSNGQLTIDGDLIVNNNLSLNINGILNITGNLITNNEATIIINGGGTVEIGGDATINNKANLIVNGTMNVDGSVAIGNNANLNINNQGSFTIGNNLSFGTNANINNNNILNAGGQVSFDTTPDQFVGDGTVTLGGTGCDTYTGSGSCYENVLLPVELLSFNAIAYQGHKVKLEWETASELNNDYFSIERSVDGKNFEVIATESGSGTKKSNTKYSYIDENPGSKDLYYRLSQTDFDGTQETFRPVYVKLKGSIDNNISVYPNPMTGNKVTLKTSQPEKGNISVYDQSGNLVYQQDTDGSSLMTEINIDKNLVKGIYVLQYTSESLKESLKLVKN